MSHGSSASDKCEPNLVPMLDMVLQLVMFFMVCANFVMEQVSEAIRLPESIVAKALDKKEQNIMFLNIDKNGNVLLSALDADEDNRTLTNPMRVQNYMKRRAAEDRRAEGGDKPLTRLLVIRADKETPFEKVYAVMKACQLAGYSRAQLRVIAADARPNAP